MNRALARRVGITLAVGLVAFASRLIVMAWAVPAVGEWAAIGTVTDARTGAASVTLPDGGTLVAGGVVDGTATDSVVVYDPVANEFSTVGQLPEARTGHTATLLADGTVLITGGTVNDLISSDIFVFDPSSGTSTPVITGMANPRTGHAAARLGDDTVLIVGGNAVEGVILQSAEIFDPTTGSVTALQSGLATPRTGASATTLIDGRVLIAGGSDGTQDLASAEVYEGVSQAFEPATTELSVARSGHTAILLPHNNSVLIAGGSSGGAPQSASDLFLPALFPDPYSYGMGTFAATGSMAAARTGAVGGSTSADGHAFVAGGGWADAEVYGFATIKTDKDDYAPGEPAVITGSGWQPGEAVKLVFQEDPAVHQDYVIDNALDADGSPVLDADGNPVKAIVADENGNIYYDQWAPEEHDLGVRFYMMAMGQESGRRAQTTFTDNAVVDISNPNPSDNNRPWHRTDAGGFDVTITGTNTCTPANGTGGRCHSPVGVSLELFPDGSAVAFATKSATLNSPSTGNWTVTFEFRTVPAGGQFSIPSDGMVDAKATYTWNVCTGACDTPTGTASSSVTSDKHFGVDNTAPAIVISAVSFPTLTTVGAAGTGQDATSGAKGEKVTLVLNKVGGLSNPIQSDSNVPLTGNPKINWAKNNFVMPTDPGDYCFVAFIEDRAGNPGSTSAATSGPHCFTVAAATPDVSVAVSPSSGLEDGGPNLVYTFTRTTTTGALTVNFSVGGTASLTTDYTQTGATSFTPPTGTVSFADGSGNATVTVDPVTDTTDENDETVVLTVTSGSGYNVATPTVATGTITDDDAAPTLAIGDVTQVETNAGTTTFAFTVTKTGSTALDVTVNYATAVGVTNPATAGACGAGIDYVAVASTPLTIPAANPSNTFNVTVCGDTSYELDETFLVNLSGATNATISDAQAVGTITNDDTAPTLAIGDVTQVEGNGPGTTTFTFTVTKTGTTEVDATVDYATAVGVTNPATAGACGAGIDYPAVTSTTLTILAADPSNTFSVTVCGDTTYELNETFLVNLTTPANATISDDQATGTITNDDAAPTLAIGDVSASETDLGTTFTFTVTKSGNVTEVNATVHYATTSVGGTATAGASCAAGVDYQSTSGDLTFIPSDSSESIIVTVCGDDLAELDETFFVDLTVPVHATTSDAQGLGTIQNDDSVPIVTNNNTTKNSTTGIQYSDPIDSVTMTATDADTPCANLSASTEYKVDAGAFGVGLPNDLTLTTNACAGVSPLQRTWTLSGKMQVLPGIYVIRVTVSDGTNTGSTEVTIKVVKEYVNLEYTGDSAQTISQPLPGSATFLMNAAVTESDTDYGEHLGDAGVKVRFTMKDGATTVGTCDSTITVDLLVDGKAVTDGCDITLTGLIVGALYTIDMVLIDSGYYEGTGEGFAASIVATPGRTTGGFWFYEPLVGGGVGRRVNGGINATYQDVKKKTGAKGNANLVRRVSIDLSTLHPSLPGGGAKDYNFHIKSNATTQFTITCTGTGDAQVCKSTFMGKATVKAIDRLTGNSYDVGAALGGSVQFQFDVTDAGEPGSSPGVGLDRVSVRVWTASKTILILDTTPSNNTYVGTEQILINGGNIQVRP